jgi:DNA-binding Xre family transcriptional regulator
MPVRLKVRALAEAKGLNLSTFQREAKLPMSTARRVWFSTSTGSVDGEPLQQISFDVIDHLCQFFSVSPGELFERFDDVSS